ncbi:MAG: cytochrome P450 [Gemmatimonadota bacterium]
MSAGTGRGPGPEGLGVLAVLLKRARDPFRVMVDLAREYGDVVEVRVGDTRHFLVSSADLARYVLVENGDNYEKGPGYALWGRVLGKGLVTSDGEHWRTHRRLVQPSLHPDRMGGFVDLMAEVAESEARRLAASSGGVVDLFDRTTRITLRIAARAFLGSDLREREDEVCEALVQVFEHIQGLSASPLRALALLPGIRMLHPLLRSLQARAGTGERRFDEALETLDAAIGAVIRRRRATVAQGEVGDDLVSRLLAAASEDPETRLTDRDVRDEVMTMFVAGHETTATGLAWCLRLLADHPEHQQRIADEARTGLGEGRVTLAALDRLPHARRVFQESLRLYPPVWRLSRCAREADRLGRVQVPAGSTVIISPWMIHRDPAAWPDPDRFDPGRFDDPSWPRSSYLPFGGGRRMCPGGGFATVEAQVVLATLARRVVLRPVTPAPPLFEPRLTRRPRGGMPLRVLAPDPAPSTP